MQYCDRKTQIICCPNILKAGVNILFEEITENIYVNGKASDSHVCDISGN